MPNCFVFAIGGTGSRVLRSLTHLLASGVKPKNNFDIIPIIIDPHHANLDLQRTESLLKNYKKVKELSNADGFFNTKIKTLLDLRKEAEIPSSFTFKLEGADSKFGDYIGYKSMGDENKYLTDLLFSGYSKDKRKEECKLLDIEMDIGFVGNPNVGSVVLDQFKDSKVYGAFASALNQEDRIFIISSIFGGTGAAGFPSLLKNIREGRGGQNKDFLSNSKIGAVSVLPYFKLEKDEKSPISYSDFVAKTKSALYYYKDNVTGNNSVNAMYYIGDNPDESYKNDPGYGGQKNKANFIEIASALAIIDFLNLSDDSLKCERGRAQEPLYKEFSIKNDAKKPSFLDLENDSEKILTTPMSQFALFRKYIKEEYENSADKKGWSTESPKLSKDFLQEDFYRNYLKPYFEDYDEFLKELRENNRGFAPLNIDGELNLLIEGRPIKTGLFSGGFTYNSFNDFLNENCRKQEYGSKAEKLIKLFYNSTKKILSKEYKI